MQPSPNSPHPYCSDRQLTLLLTRISANASDTEVTFGEFMMLYKVSGWGKVWGARSEAEEAPRIAPATT